LENCDSQRCMIHYVAGYVTCNVLRTQVGHISKWATNPYFPTLKIDYSTTTRWIILKLKLNIPDISILMLSKFF
jgi:hypothetical protein